MKQAAALKALGAVLVAIIVIGSVVYFAGLNQIDEGHNGVHTDRGAATGEVHDPGWVWTMPLVEDVKDIPIRPQTYTMAEESWEGDTDENDAIVVMSADQQNVQASVTVRYNVPHDQAVEFYSTWKSLGQAEERLIRPVTEAVVQESISSMNATQANSDEGREALASDISQTLQEETGAEVSVDSVQVRDITLDPAYQQELENIEIANAQAEQRVIDAEGEAEAEITRAEGDAEAHEIRDEALTDAVLQDKSLDQIDDTDKVIVTDEAGQDMIIDASNESGS